MESGDEVELFTVVVLFIEVVRVEDGVVPGVSVDACTTGHPLENSIGFHPKIV